MTTLLFTHPCFLDHDTGPGHPERADRLRAIGRVLEHEVFNPLIREESPKRDDAEEAILLAHTREHLATVLRVDRTARAEGESQYFDPDTPFSPASLEAALRAVSGGLEAVDRIMAGKARNAFLAHRPPGHHAEHNRPMGFCFFANIAIAGLYTRKRYGAERIAVVDFDVHHGNGTQDVFWADRDLFLGSTHQMPLFPGTGALSETGAGNIFNAPLNPGDGSEKFRAAFTERILPALANHRPDFVFISAGFDAHRDDPLGNIELDERDFAWATSQILEVADRYAQGRVVSMLEGGYNLKALAQSVGVHVRALMAG